MRAQTKAKKLSAFAALNVVALSVVCQATFAAGLRFPGDPVVVMDTTKGPIKVEIYKKKAPITANNFLDLVGRNFYNGLTFHRYVEGFCIQGGDPKGTGGGGYEDPETHRERTIKLERVDGLNHDSAGVIAMARTPDPDTASSQFYFALAPQPNLDHPPDGSPGYAVFGRVVSGMDTVMKLRKGDKMTKVYVEK